jgi:hypothetical protein
LFSSASAIAARTARFADVDNVATIKPASRHAIARSRIERAGDIGCSTLI